MGIVMRIGSLAFMLVHGLALGYQPLAGYCYGAKLFGRLKEGFKVTITIGTVLSALFAAIGLTLAPQAVFQALGKGLESMLSILLAVTLFTRLMRKQQMEAS
jgi:Na+-driven multidrug efflux pump